MSTSASAVSIGAEASSPGSAKHRAAIPAPAPIAIAASSRWVFPAPASPHSSKTGLVDVAGDESRQQRDELGVASRKKIGQSRRLGRRELEDQLFHRRLFGPSSRGADRDARGAAARRDIRGRLERFTFTYR